MNFDVEITNFNAFIFKHGKSAFNNVLIYDTDTYLDISLSLVVGLIRQCMEQSIKNQEGLRHGTP